MFMIRLTGTRLHKFLLEHLPTIALGDYSNYIRVFSECPEIKDGMLMVILALKNLYLPLENIFFFKPEVGYT